MFRNFRKIRENSEKVKQIYKQMTFPNVQITFYASKSKSIMSRIEQKINSYNLFYFRIWTQVQKDEIASGELIHTVWKNTQLATQIRGECSKLTLLSPSRPPEKKNWPHTTRGFEPVISVQEAIFSVSTHISKVPLFSSGNSKCDTCDNAIQRGCFSEELIRGRCHSVSRCSSRSFTTRQSSRVTWILRL